MNTEIRNIHYYQSANLSDSEIKQLFVVRQKVFQRIISEVRRDDMSGSIQHYILKGWRGSGKSTLLRRIQAEVNCDETLNEKLVVIYPGEEQAGIYRLCDLWETVLNELEVHGYKVEKINWENFSDDLLSYSRELYAGIQKALKSKNKKMLLLLDNIDRIFDNIGEDAKLLRELLINYKDVRIIGGSTRMSEHYWKYDMPFYEFFNIISLDSLSTEEVKTLLLYWGEYLNRPEISEFVEKHPGRIEAVKILTDGMPRTLVHFLELLITRSEQNGFEYLRYIIDKASPLYQERLHSLPEQKKKIVLELGLFWDAVKVEQLIDKCKLTNKVISSQLNQLVQKDVVKKIRVGKNNVYQLSERFFNLWLLMTQGGPKEKQQVKHLTVFLENWYDKDELQLLFDQHVKQLSSGKMKEDHALLMSHALAHSRYITTQQRDELIAHTYMLFDKNSERLRYMPDTSKKIYEKAYQTILDGRYEEARDILTGIDKDDATTFSIIALSYHLEGKVHETEEFYFKAIDKGDVNALNGLAYLYAKTNRQEEAEEFYLKAIDKGHVNALNNLANLYAETNRQEEAEDFYLKAIEKGHVNALNNLAYLYAKTNRQEEAEEFYLKAIEKGSVKALNNLSHLYYTENRNKSTALDLIQRYIIHDKNDLRGRILYTIILLWTGKIKEFEKQSEKLIPELIEKEEIKITSLFIEELLVHHQNYLVWELFNSEKYGEKLKDLVKPLYYVAAGFIKTKEAKIEVLKPGHELEKTIEQITSHIKEKRAFYYDA